jgi:hypothetical protein
VKYITTAATTATTPLKRLLLNNFKNSDIRKILSIFAILTSVVFENTLLRMSYMPVVSCYVAKIMFADQAYAINAVCTVLAFNAIYTIRTPNAKRAFGAIVTLFASDARQITGAIGTPLAIDAVFAIGTPVTFFRSLTEFAFLAVIAILVVEISPFYWLRHSFTQAYRYMSSP